MKLDEALKSGKPYKRKSWSEYQPAGKFSINYYTDINDIYGDRSADILAADYELFDESAVQFKDTFDLEELVRFARSWKREEANLAPMSLTPTTLTTAKKIAEAIKKLSKK